MIDDIKLRINAAISDIQTAGTHEPSVQSLTLVALRSLNDKANSINDAKRLIEKAMKEEVSIRTKMMALAEKMIIDNDSSYERDVSRFRNTLFEEDNSMAINSAIRSLRDAMDVQVDISDILRTAEGNAGGAQVASVPE
jgi:wyosine [tRNA(Phe)-imidazoG37] synthetase (radical SAM superfamily)